MQSKGMKDLIWHACNGWRETQDKQMKMLFAQISWNPSKNEARVNLDLFSASLLISIYCLSWSQETLTTKCPNINHTCKVKISLKKTCVLGLCSLQSRKYPVFFSNVYPQGTHVVAVWKEKQEELWVTCSCFCFRGLMGRITARYTSRKPPGEGGEGG